MNEMSTERLGIEVGSPGTAEMLKSMGLTEQKTITKTKVIEIEVPADGPVSSIEKVGKGDMSVGKPRPAGRKGKRSEYVKLDIDHFENENVGVSPSETKESESRKVNSDETSEIMCDPNPPDDYIRPKEGMPGWFGADYFFDLAPLLVKMHRGLRILLTGARGTGKTTGVHYLAKKLGMKIITVNCNSTMEADSLLGCCRIRTGEGGGDYWQPGPLYWAARFNCILFLNEVTNMAEKAQIGLNPLADGLMAGYTNMYTGERITWKSPVIIMDGNEGYGGNKQVQEALRDRFTTVQCGYMEKVDEVKMIQGRFPKVANVLINKAVNTAEAIRRAAVGINSDGSTRQGAPLRFDMSPRALLDWAEGVSIGENEHTAWRRAVLGRVGWNAMNQETMSAVAEISETAGWKVKS